MDFTQQPHLPTEIWELIFGNCSAPDLRRFRLVCHRWNDIVMGCTSLWNRFHVWFSQRNEHLSPAMLPPVRSATLDGDVEVAGSWWPSFGERLEGLFFESSTISMTALFHVLKHCTNLKRLYFAKIRMLEGQVDDDFSLDFMEELHIHELQLNGIDLPSRLGTILPCLKELRIFYINDSSAAFTNNCWTNFIHVVQGTLQVLYLPSELFLARQLCQMNRLRLKGVELDIDCSPHPRNIELWITFCRLQQSLQDLSFAGTNITNEILCVTVQNLPNLKILRSCLSCSRQTVPTFLHGPNNLQTVQICGIQAILLFRTWLSPTLTELLLGYVTINGGIEYVINSPNIAKLDLLSCDLSSCRVPAGNSSGLRHLRLSHGKSTPQMLDYILSCHPRLECAEFFDMQFIDKGSIVKLLCASPKLRKIRLHNCSQLGAASGAEIMLDYVNVPSAEGSRIVRFDINDYIENIRIT